MPSSASILGRMTRARSASSRRRPADSAGASSTQAPTSIRSQSAWGAAGAGLAAARRASEPAAADRTAQVTIRSAGATGGEVVRLILPIEYPVRPGGRPQEVRLTIVARIGMPLLVAALAAPAAPVAAAPSIRSPAAIVVCAPGYPGTTGAAQPTMDAFASAAAAAAGWPAGSVRAAYFETAESG